MFPTTISTIADLLTLLEYTYRLAKFFSPRIKKALRETRTVLLQSNKAGSVDTAKAILSEELSRFTPPDQTDMTFQDLGLVFEIIAPLMEKEQGCAVPLYGEMINMMISTIWPKLDTWRCFEEWGELLPTGAPGSRLMLLLAPNTTQSLQKNKQLMKWLRSPLEFGKFHFAKNEYVGTLVLTNRKYQELNYSRALDYNWLHFGELGVEVFDDNAKYYRSKYYQFSSTEFDRVASGLLSDLNFYSRLVSGEVRATKDIFSKFKNSLGG